MERLLDHGTFFLELSALAAMGLYEDEVPAAGMISGLGVISGRLCVIVANDALSVVVNPDNDWASCLLFAVADDAVRELPPQAHA